MVGWLVAQKNWTVITEFSWEYLFMIYIPVEEYIILLVEIKIRGGGVWMLIQVDPSRFSETGEIFVVDK